MLDVQKERLRHMVANAILELWKKETGSLSPVIIEGTICITAGSGRTTVVQVANHFPGSIPEGLDNDTGPTYHTPKRKLMNLKPMCYSSPLVSPSIHPSCFNDFSPIGVQSPGFILPGRMSSHKASFRKPLQSNASSELSMDISSVKEEETTDLEEDEPVQTVDNEHHTKEDNRNDNVQEHTRGPLYTEGDSSDKKDNKNDLKTNADIDKSTIPETPPDLDDTHAGDALDLSASRSNSKEDDLALSPPQNYTAQVRNVIRQRLLASRENSNESPTVDTPEEEPEQQSIPKFPGLSPLPPLTNLNLNSPSMIPYPPPFSTASQLIDTRTSRESLITSPEMLSPGGRSSTTSPFDQNGNNKETLYVNDKGETQKVYKCNFCSKTFLFKSKYYEHLPVHTNVRPFQCNLCSRTYKYKYDLRVHVRTHMGIPTKSTVCPFCSVKFDTNKMLRLHIQDFHRSNLSGDHSITSSAEGSTASLVINEDGSQ